MGLFSRDRNLSRAPTELELAVSASDFQIPPAELAIRLDAFLRLRLSWRSRTSIQKLIEEGFVQVAPSGPGLEPSRVPAQVERRSSRNLRHGARVVVVIPPENRLPERLGGEGEVQVLYEDDEVLAVEKPAGQAVHPSGRHLAGTLIQEVHARYSSEAELPIPVRLCHRIDKETSGIVLLGKGDRAHRGIRRQFERHEIEKEYLAVVRGVPEEAQGRIDYPLGPAHASQVRLKIAVQEGGWSATTLWRRLESHGRFTLLSCTPLTGRQHQIRVHLAAIGFPIVGDKLYGEDERLFLRGAEPLEPGDLVSLGLPRQALHSHRLAWRSPATGERREVVSPLPADLQGFLGRAREGAG